MVTTHYIKRSDLPLVFNRDRLPVHMVMEEERQSAARRNAEQYLERVKRNNSLRWTMTMHRDARSYFNANLLPSETYILVTYPTVDEDLLKYTLIERMWNAFNTGSLLDALCELRLIAYEMNSYDEMKLHHSLMRSMMNKINTGGQEHIGRKGDWNNVAVAYLGMVDKIWNGVHGWNH